MVSNTLEKMKKLEYFEMSHNDFVNGVANLRKVLAKLGLKPKEEKFCSTEYSKWKERAEFEIF